MSTRTFIRQNAQIAPSVTFDDTVSSGATMETTSATNLEDDLNNLRSQINRILDDSSGNWYDDIPTVNSKQRDLLDLNTDLDDLEEKKILCRTNNLTDLTVGAGNNYAILSFAGGETPTEVKALAAATDGAVTVASASSGAGFEAHELIEVAGPDALNPKNLMVVRSATTGQTIQSSGRDVFALLQVESGSVDGEAFSDAATKRAKLSFVRPNAAFTDLEAVPASDIQSTAINYAYVRRIKFDDVPEDCFLSNGNFVDNVAAVDVTLQNAYDSQGTTPTQLGSTATLDLNADAVAWLIRDLGNATLFEVIEGSTGSNSQLNVGAAVDELDIDAADVSFANGIAVGDAGTEITINETAGEINRAADLRLKATGAGELFFADSNEPAGWSLDGIKLSEDAATWTNFEAAFGEVSLMEAIIAANSSGGSVTKTCATVTAAISANSSIGGPATANNLSSDLPALVGFVSDGVGGATFSTDNDVYLNGVLMQGGINAAADCDYYPGTTSAELRFEFDLNATPLPDVLCVITRN